MESCGKLYLTNDETVILDSFYRYKVDYQSLKEKVIFYI